MKIQVWVSKQLFFTSFDETCIEEFSDGLWVPRQSDVHRNRANATCHSWINNFLMCTIFKFLKQIEKFPLHCHCLNQKIRVIDAKLRLRVWSCLKEGRVTGSTKSMTMNEHVALSLILIVSLHCCNWLYYWTLWDPLRWIYIRVIFDYFQKICV